MSRLSLGRTLALFALAGTAVAVSGVVPGASAGLTDCNGQVYDPNSVCIGECIDPNGVLVGGGTWQGPIYTPWVVLDAGPVAVYKREYACWNYGVAVCIDGSTDIESCQSWAYVAVKPGGIV